MSGTQDQTINLEETARLLAAASTNENNISLQDAANLTANYRTFHGNNPLTVRGGLFSRGIIDQMLAQNDCTGIRYYYGMDSNNVPQLVLVGVDSNNNDLYNGVLAERARLCPPSWPNSNPLNPDGILSLAPPVNHEIGLTEAAQLTATYRAGFASGTDLIRGGLFTRAIIDTILSQQGCEGIRYYYGLDDNQVPHIVLTGVDSAGNDQYTMQLAERARLCPPSWPVALNPLNP